MKHRPYAWVVTVIPRVHLADHLSPTDPALSVAPTELPAIVEYEEGQTLFSFEKQSFHKHQLVCKETEYMKKYSIMHYDPLSGFSYDVMGREAVPFDNLTTIFNDKNMWFNVQPTTVCTHPTFTWDLDNAQKWVPFLTPDLIIRPGQVLCSFATPTFINRFSYATDPVQKNHQLVTELAELLTLYRRNVLYIPTTTFFRPICAMVQAKMDSRSAGGEGDVEESMKDEWWSNKHLVENLDQACTALLPSCHFWNGGLYQFMDIERNLIFEQLGIYFY